VSTRRLQPAQVGPGTAAAGPAPRRSARLASGALTRLNTAMRRTLGTAALAAALSLAASAYAADAPSPCLIVYGHGRNIGVDEAQNAAWDRLNAQFNERLTERLQQLGLQATPLLFKIGVTDIGTALAQLLAEAERRRCTRVADTAVFANDETQTLVVRLRVHPLQDGRIGEPLYTAQHEVDLNPRNLQRLDFAALARQMADGYQAGQR
jgi:hypothetical protein